MFVMDVKLLRLTFTPGDIALTSGVVSTMLINAHHHFPAQACNTTKSCAPLQLSHKTPTTQSPLCGVPQGTAALCLKIKVVEVKQHVYRWGEIENFPAWVWFWMEQEIRIGSFSQSHTHTQICACRRYWSLIVNLCFDERAVGYCSKKKSYTTWKHLIVMSHYPWWQVNRSCWHVVVQKPYWEPALAWQDTEFVGNSFISCTFYKGYNNRHTSVNRECVIYSAPFHFCFSRCMWAPIIPGFLHEKQSV